MSETFIERDLFKEVFRHLKEREMTVITGARQVGKSTLIRQLRDHLVKSGEAKENEIKTFDLDLITDLELFSSQKEFIRYLRIEAEGKKKLYIFVDEVQRLESPGVFFKGIYDLGLSIKLVLTGSSSLEIKARIQEPLTGRKRLFTLYPFSFREFLGRESSLVSLLNGKEMDVFHRGQILDRFFNYLVYGGYPRVATEQNENNKHHILKEIFSSYVEKDIVGFLKIRQALQFSRLVSLLAGQLGQLVNVKELSNSLDMKQSTVLGYLRVLEQTFVCSLVRPFFKNARKELTKMPRIYFWDSGLRNLGLEAFRPFGQREDRGMLVENFVFAELAREAPGWIRYWRTKDKSEVDLVIAHPGGTVIPIEVKAQALKNPDVPRGLAAFIKRYHPPRAWVVNMGISQKIKLGETAVHFIYPFQTSQILQSMLSA